MTGSECFGCNGSGWEPPPHPDQDDGTTRRLPVSVRIVEIKAGTPAYWRGLRLP